MIYDHSNGYEEALNRRKIYGWEIELLCANSQNGRSLEAIKRMMALYKQLQTQYPEQVLIKESENHFDDAPYFDTSLFCNKDDVIKFSQLVISLGMVIDFIHNHDEQISFEFNDNTLNELFPE